MVTDLWWWHTHVRPSLIQKFILRRAKLQNEDLRVGYSNYESSKNILKNFIYLYYSLLTLIKITNIY